MADELPYEVDDRIFGETVVAYQCPHCAHHLESPLHEAGTTHDCPTCQHPFVTPGLKEKAAEDAERERKEEAERVEQEKRRAQELAAVSVKPTEHPPAELVWYGGMVCHSCGYRWKARRNTPPARCASCSGRNISPVRVPPQGCTVGFVILAIFGVVVLVKWIG